MLFNYFSNLSMLGLYQNFFKKAMIERIYWVISSQQKRVVSSKIWEGYCQPKKFTGWTWPFFPLTLLTFGLFCLFQQFFACEKVILLKDRKLQLWSIFHCQDILKNRLLSEIMFPSNPVTSWKFWLVMYKEWFVLKKDHYHHEKFSSLMYMLFRKYNMVRDFSCKLMYMTVYIFELCT